MVRCDIEGVSGVVSYTQAEPGSVEYELLNGVSVGESWMEAAIAGDCGVPVLLVTGDSAGVAEAESLLPGVGSCGRQRSDRRSGSALLSSG